MHAEQILKSPRVQLLKLLARDLIQVVRDGRQANMVEDLVHSGKGIGLELGVGQDEELLSRKKPVVVLDLGLAMSA